MSGPLAHIGHWYFEVLIYCGPVVALAGWVWWADRRTRRRRRRAPDRPLS